MGIFDLFGGDGGSSADNLTQSLWAGSRMYNQGMNQAQEVVGDYLNRALGYMQPYNKAGSAAANEVGGLLNLPGYSPVDRTAYLTSTPGYQFGLKQGMDSLNSAMAARGLYGSGPQREAAIKYGTDYGQNYFNQLINQLTGQEQLGYNAGVTSGNWNMNAGKDIAGLEAAMAGNAQNTMVTGATAQYQNDLQRQQAQSQGLDSLFGLGLGLATSPFMGGTSLLGTGADALGSAMGNIGPYLGMSMTLPDVYAAGAGSNMAFNPNIFGGWNLAG